MLATSGTGGSPVYTNNWVWNDLNQLTQVTQTGPGLIDKQIDLTYTPTGRPDRIDRFEIDGATTYEVATSAYTYDELDRLTQINYFTQNDANGTTTPGSVLAFYRYSYGVDYQINSFDTVDGIDHYYYDQTDQLVEIESNYADDQEFDYDANGNRLTQTVTDGSNNETTDTYSQAVANRLAFDGTWDYEYDAEGNRTRKYREENSSVVEDIEYAWDHRNRLTTITFKDGAAAITKTVEYTYDVNNRPDQ